jgi:large subunit ribosomal protein L31
MKEKIHPPYQDCEIRCTCGNVIKTRSTKKEISIAICGKCHPFYTGKQKFVDTAGRIEKFQKKFSLSEGQTVTTLAEKQKAAQKQAVAKAKGTVIDVIASAPKKRKKAPGQAEEEAAAEAAFAKRSGGGGAGGGRGGQRGSRVGQGLGKNKNKGKAKGDGAKKEEGEKKAEA